MSQVTHMNESCPAYLSHGQRLLCIALCRLTHELATSHMIQSWHIDQCVQFTGQAFLMVKDSCASHFADSHTNSPRQIWLSHVKEKWVMTHISMCTTYRPRCLMVKGSCASHLADSHMNEPHHIWLSHVKYGWVMTHINVYNLQA